MISVIQTQVMLRQRFIFEISSSSWNFLFWFAFVIVVVVIWTFETFLAILITAWLRFIHQRVIFLFFPALTMWTAAHSLATLVVFCNESARRPRCTYLSVVNKKVGFSPEILPVMSINTLGFIVVFVVGAPLCLKVEHVKVLVLVHLVDESGLEFFDTVRKAAVVAIFALTQLFGKLGAELCLVPFRMIKALYSIVR